MALNGDLFGLRGFCYELGGYVKGEKGDDYNYYCCFAEFCHCYCLLSNEFLG